MTMPLSHLKVRHKEAKYWKKPIIFLYLGGIEVTLHQLEAISKETKKKREKERHQKQL